MTLRRFNHHFTICSLALASLIFGLCADARATDEASVRLNARLPGARAFAASEDDNLLWRNATPIFIRDPNQPTASEQQLSLRAAIAADPNLNEFYSWRQMARGLAQREWKFGASKDGKGGARLSAGAQQLPTLKLAGISGTRAAVLLQNDRFGLGSTRPMRMLDKAFSPTDETLGEATSYDQSRFDWITARPLNTPRAQINLIYLRGQNDLNPTSRIKYDNQIIAGSMTGATMNFALPGKWNLSGEWLNSKMKGRGSDSAWLLGLSGPLRHPFGTAQVQASYRNIGADFSSFVGTPFDAGAVSKELSVQQPFGKGTWSGALGLTWLEREYAEDSVLGVAREDSSLHLTASTRWQATPKLALTLSHVTNRNTLDPASGILTGQQSSDTQAGVEWKLNSDLALVLGWGASRNGTLADEDLIALSGKNRLSLGLRGQSAGTMWNLQMARDDLMAPPGTAANAEQSLAIDADRQLASWLKLGATYRFYQDAAALNGAAPADLTTRAALSFKRLGAFELRYRQVRSLDGVYFPRNGEPVRGYGLNYQWGAREGQKGFGLWFDYAKNLTVGVPENQWKIGVNYR